MNRKGICRLLTKKHREFCASIKDEDVRKLVEKNSFITGGSIVSLLLKEPVKDYDYYLAGPKTAIAVAKYYVQQFISNNPDGIVPEVRNGRDYDDMADDRVKIYISSLGQASEEGGSYYETMDAIDAVSEADETEVPEDDGKKYRPVFLSANAITLSDKVQIVIRFHGSPEEVHENYDFDHCKCFWEPGGNGHRDYGKLTLPPTAMESIITKQLRYSGSLYPLCSVIRTRKFLKRGWYINAGQYLKMCFQISELDLTDLNVLEEQLTGVDAAYFWEIIQYCRQKTEEDDGFKVTAPYLATIIDKIF